MLEFLAFPSIEGFHSLVKFNRQFSYLLPETVNYRGKIKLHGTNAAIRISPDGSTVLAQSRSQIITESNDNCGFAKWVKENEDYFKSLDFGVDLTIFCEWVGPGIMSGCAIHKIPNKIAAIFAIYLGNTEIGDFVIDPEKINNVILKENKPSNLYVLPWQGEQFVVDFKNNEALQTVADNLNKIVNEIEPCDPWVFNTFGIEGVAEGIVYYPIFNDPCNPVQKDSKANLNYTYKNFENMVFKAKGDKHKVVHKQTNSVQVDPTILASVEAFVNMFCVENRFQQGLTAIGGIADSKLTGAFLKWCCTDIQKESKSELEASKLEWKDVEKSIATASRTWFLNKSKEI